MDFPGGFFVVTLPGDPIAYVIIRFDSPGSLCRARPNSPYPIEGLYTHRASVI
ncbi:hypothetical protein HMPREF9412_3029 [Paenibacillus sp. HGF5]|nr:hypothetical protein HMPREF9412_3029 [Paenibacillus sp. HGF5]